MAKLFDIFLKRKQIFEGIMNSLFTHNDVEEIAAKRLEVCNSCPHIDREGDKCFVPATKPCCGVCGCKLGFKVRSLSESCPDPDGERWEAILSPDEEAEVNTKIGYDPNEPTQKPTQDGINIQS